MKGVSKELEKKYSESFPKIYELYSTGNYTLKQLEEIFQIDYEKISEKLKIKGFKINAHGKKEINSDIFETIDTEAKAYWLGFLYADGCVYRNNKGYYRFELGLKESDFYHVENFKNFISSSHTIKYRQKTKSCRLSFGDDKFCRDLIKLGCIPNKSLILKFPTEEQVPNHLMNHFIRGYIDGDGYISKKAPKKALTIDILGTYEFLKGLCKVLNINFYKILKKDKRNKNNTYNIYFCGDTARKVGNYIYQDAIIFLIRKKENYDSHPLEFRKDTVSQYDLNGNFIKDYYNGSSAAKEVGLSHSSISKSCYSGTPTGGFIFKFKDR